MYIIAGATGTLGSAISEELSKDNISKITKDSSINAINKSDIILFVIDSRNSLTPDDYSLASIVRKSGKKVILIANKCEGRLSLIHI